MRVIERARTEVLAETGVDFGRYRTAELAGRLDVWRLGGRIVLDLAVAMSAGVVVAVAVLALGSLLDGDGDGRWAVAAGATAVGLAVLVLVASARLVARTTAEVGTVFDLAADIASQASADLEQVAGSLDAVVRGLVVVGAVPLIADVASRRFLVLAPLIRRSVELIGGMVLDRALPTLPSATRHPGPVVQRLADRLADSRATTASRVGRASRWVALPFRLWAGGAAALGIVLLSVGLILGA